MTSTQRDMIAHAILLAENASTDLGSRDRGVLRARPTVAQINGTLSRLQSIIRVLEAAL